MARPNKRTLLIRSFLLQAVSDHPRDLVAAASKRFGLSRQAINRHVQTLVDEGQLVACGVTRRRAYKLATVASQTASARIEGLEEHVLWRNDVAHLLGDLQQNTLDIWQYGFTEMVNNVIDHSAGTTIFVTVEATAISTIMWIMDDGVGVFKKIQSGLGLEDERHAVLELSKGKLTTDPENHTGEGIFFCSRMFDEYAILSGGVVFSHQIDKEEDWIHERERPERGTAVYMSLDNDCRRTTKQVFDKYSSKNGEYGFTRTVVPVRLLRHGLEKLVSRSQAKRLLARFERFEVVMLDFAGVDIIGQAFADEVFRVFVKRNPDVKIVPINTGPEIKKMINRVKHTGTT